MPARGNGGEAMLNEIVAAGEANPRRSLKVRKTRTSALIGHGDMRERVVNND